MEKKTKNTLKIIFSIVWLGLAIGLTVVNGEWEGFVYGASFMCVFSLWVETEVENTKLKENEQPVNSEGD